MIAIDTNVLVYAHRAETSLHEVALAKLRALCEGNRPWALPLPCLSEFFRVVTHPKVLNPPSTLDEALDFARVIVGAPTCRLLAPGSSYLEHFFALMREADARGNLVFDAQIVALCVEQGISRVLTNDRDFARFPGVAIEQL